MGCIIDNGYTLGCNTIGGIERVYIGTFDADTTYTLDIDNQIIGATGANTVFLFEQDIEFSGLEQTGQFSRENGTVFYESILSIKLIELTKELRNTMISLGRAPIYAVIKSNAGQHYLLGKESSGRATEGAASLGVAQGDMNGVSLSFTWKTPNGAFLMDEAVLGTDIIIG